MPLSLSTRHSLWVRLRRSARCAHANCALPGLLLGQNVEIYASNNSGRTYKLGYIAGINMCGLIFFGSAFWRLGKIASPLSSCSAKVNPYH